MNCVVVSSVTMRSGRSFEAMPDSYLRRSSS